MRVLRRLREESVGQGVIEVLAVFGVFGALVAVGVPAWFGYQDGKSDRAARRSTCSRRCRRPRSTARSTAPTPGLDTVDLARIDPRVSMTLVVYLVAARPLLPDGERATAGSGASPGR